MSLKGVIQPDHLPKNLFELKVPGAPPLTFTKVSGLEEELEVVELPDRTKASGGQTKPVEFTVMLPEHHAQQVAFMELWYKQGQHPIVPGYKRACTLIRSRLSGITKSYSLLGVFVSKRKTDDLEMSNEGDMSEQEWTIQADAIIPI